jgi:glycosyltransferase involved in cell wall biosynthesis
MFAENRPLVSFTIFTFNQEDLVREAIDGALAQSYQPLEVIISDDCSSDATYDVILSAVSGYRGPHTIRLNRNSVNLGLGAHVALVHAMAQGSVIVHAAGDDVSLPFRVSRIMEEYLRQPSRSVLIESNAFVINDAGDVVGTYHKDRASGVYETLNPWQKVTAGGGATYAISRDLIDCFDPIPADFIAEDGLLNVRANLLSGVLYIAEPLMKYRVSDRGMWNQMIGPGLSHAVVVANEVKWTGHRLRICEQASLDAARLGETGRLSFEHVKQSLVDLARARVELDEWLALLQGSLNTSVAALIWGLFRREHIERIRWAKMFLLRWFGRHVNAARRLLGLGG